MKEGKIVVHVDVVGKRVRTYSAKDPRLPSQQFRFDITRKPHETWEDLEQLIREVVLAATGVKSLAELEFIPHSLAPGR